jgi:hypothetical protein
MPPFRFTISTKRGQGRRLEAITKDAGIYAKLQIAGRSKSSKAAGGHAVPSFA